MAITEAYTGSATISTNEYSLVNNSTSLASIASPGVYQIFVDTENMVSGDEYRIQIKDKVTSGGIQRTLYNAILEGNQSSPFVTPSLILYHGWDVTITQITGTSRVIDWSIRKVG